MSAKNYKTKYFSHVKPRFKEIEKWVKHGATRVNVAKNLGIGVRTLAGYLETYEEFADLYKKAQITLVQDVRGILVKRAMGFQYTESEKTTEADGSVRIKTWTKAALPDVAAANLILKNYDKSNWANDPQQLALKKEELELKKKAFEQGNW